MIAGEWKAGVASSLGFMSTVDPTGPTVIATPEDRPVGGVPALVALVVLVLAVVASFVLGRLLPRLVLADLAAKVAVVVAAIGLMTSVERGMQQRLDARTSTRPAIVSALVLVLALVAGIVGGVGCLRISPALGDRGSLGLGVLVAGLWLAGLSLGTLLMRAVVWRGTLQARMTRILVAGFVIAALSSIAGARYASRALELINERAPELFAVWSPYRERALSSLGLPGIWTLASILLLAMPLALSGCRKLVRSTFDGLSALEAASETVAAGRLELRIEHSGGSREVAKLVQSYNDMLQSLLRVRGLERAFLPRSEAARSRLRRHFNAGAPARRTSGHDRSCRDS